MVLACNGYWKPKQKLDGADERRLTGLIFNIKFVEKKPEQLLANERIKDPSIKMHPERFVTGLSFLVLAYNHIRQAYSTASGEPSGEVLLPRPPSAVEYRRHMFADHMLPDVDELVATFFRERMVEYVDAYELPTTYSDFRRELESFVAQTSIVVGDNQLNNALRRINISQEKVYVSQYKRGAISRPKACVRLCATVRADGAGTAVVKKWTLLPPGGSVLQRLAAA